MINDLKDFERFLKLCRKQGVTDVTLNGVSVKLGPLPIRAGNAADETDEIETDALSPDEMIFYAVNGGNA